MPGVYASLPQQYFDDNGNPLSSGTITTYAAGTSTPLATYSDYDLTISNANPVTLNAAGRPESGAIYLSGGTLYDIVISDSDGVQIAEMLSIGSSSGGSSSTSWPGIAEDIASASLTDLGTLTSFNGNVTGTTTINSFGSSATLDNPLYRLTFEGALTITDGANILVRTGVTAIGDDLVTAAGDVAYVTYIGSGAWKISQYYRNDGSIVGT